MTITKSKQILISEGTKLFYTGLWPQLQCTVTVMRGRIYGEIKLGSGYISPYTLTQVTIQTLSITCTR